MEPRLRKIFGSKSKRFYLEAEQANFDFRGNTTEENNEKFYTTLGHGVYGRVFIYMLPIIIILAMILF